MRQIAWPNIPGKLDEAWRRFRALSWRWKAPALSVAALCALGAALLVVAVSGGGAGDDTPPAGGETPSSGPTESPPPTSPPGNTPTAQPVAGGYRLTQTLSAADFDQMLGFYVIPGEAAAVVITKDGMLRKVPLNGGAATPFGDISDRLVNNTHIEEGLLALAFPPNYQSSKRVYLYYTTGSPDPSIVSRFPVNSGGIDVSQETVVLKVGQPYPNHNGGQILFGPDGYLYVALGDGGGGGGDPEETGQDRTDLLGSILRINVSGSGYTVPSDNPFPGNPVFA
ncbi:MAG: PQQ-dependent sugar dehydrogenase, partial [Dehalococcoidia bacterium]|nr:PQQ-dependent sugar dehydrogenase [Dehalococcoidia bacterium]